MTSKLGGMPINQKPMSQAETKHLRPITPAVEEEHLAPTTSAISSHSAIHTTQGKGTDEGR